MLESIQNLRLKLKPGQESGFLGIFQKGVYLKTRGGLPLSEVLEEAGFSRKYLEESDRILGRPIESVGDQLEM